MEYYVVKTFRRGVMLSPIVAPDGGDAPHER